MSTIENIMGLEAGRALELKQFILKRWSTKSRVSAIIARIRAESRREARSQLERDFLLICLGICIEKNNSMTQKGTPGTGEQPPPVAVIDKQDEDDEL